MRTDFMCLLLATVLYSLLYLTVNVHSQLDHGQNRTNTSREEQRLRSEKDDSEFSQRVTRDNSNSQFLRKKEDSHSSKSGDVGFHSSQEKFKVKYSNQRRSDIYTSGYQTFMGKRRRGSKSHVKTIFRKRSGYNHNGQRERSSTFESYGEADSFDRKKIRDVFDVNGYISEGRKRSKLGGYIHEEKHAFMSGGHKSQVSRNDGISLEGKDHSESDTLNQRSGSHNSEDIRRSENSTVQRRRR
ncbi:unnamed protein product [Schistosoma spindalis]|nr:unnamed protein product [Schistosoma spindale]